MLHPEPDGSVGSKLFGLFLVVLGLLGCGLIGWDAYRDWLARDWPAVPCTVVASGVEEQNGDRPYRFRILYRYDWRGRPLVGRTYRRSVHASFDIVEIERVVRTYPADARRACFVDPDAPSTAVMEREGAWGGIAAIALITTLVATVGGMYLFPVRSPVGRATLGDFPVG